MALAKAEIPQGWESERALAGRWKIPQGEMNEFRTCHLRDGFHYGKPQGLAIYYSPEGIARLKEYFGPEEEPAKQVQLRVAAAREKYYGYALPPDPLEPLSETIVAVLRLCPNPRLIWCVDVNGKRVLVKVKTHVKFRKGMKISLESCRQEPGGIYELQIPLPRWPGRWGYNSLEKGTARTVQRVNEKVRATFPEAKVSSGLKNHAEIYGSVPDVSEFV